jgi:hypothetical protein
MMFLLYSIYVKQLVYICRAFLYTTTGLACELAEKRVFLLQLPPSSVDDIPLYEGDRELTSMTIPRIYCPISTAENS